MKTSEADLAALRHADALLRLLPDFSVLRDMKDLGDPQKFAAAVQEPAIATSGDVRFSPTGQVFASDWQAGPRTVPVLAFTQLVPVLAENREWLALEHQGGGHSCRQTHMIATRFAAFPKVQAFFDEIAAQFQGALNGWFDGPESDPELTAIYETSLASQGLQLRGDGRAQLQESLYPVDGVVITNLTDDPQIVAICRNATVPPVILFLSDNSD